MKYFKSLFLNQMDRAKNIQEGHELYFFFFRFSQISTLAASFYFSLIVNPLSVDPDVLNLPLKKAWYALAIACFVTLFLCEVGLGCLDRNKIPGFYLGLALSFKFLFGWNFLLGLFGLYAFLNPSAQRKLLTDAPPWLKDLLSFFKINFTVEKEL